MNIIKVENIGYQTDQQKILSNISLELKEGEFVSLSGPSGSGKSTLLKIIASMITPTEGCVYFKDSKVLDIAPAEYRKEVSYCFQAPVLFGQTVKDNLMFPFEIRNQKADINRMENMLEAVGLKGFIDKPITELSGGEKQRIALVRNVMFEPKVLLLDEIMNGLDDMNRNIIWDWLMKIHKESNLTILSVSHNEKDVAMADRNIKLVGGKTL